jgi:hypothetical protein
LLDGRLSRRRAAEEDLGAFEAIRLETTERAAVEPGRCLCFPVDLVKRTNPLLDQTAQIALKLGLEGLKVGEGAERGAELASIDKPAVPECIKFFSLLFNVGFRGFVTLRHDGVGLLAICQEIRGTALAGRTGRDGQPAAATLHTSQPLPEQDLPTADFFDRFLGVAGSAYIVGGLGMTTLTSADGHMVVVPILTGLGLRLGANLGSLKFTGRPT